MIILYDQLEVDLIYSRDEYTAFYLRQRKLNLIPALRARVEQPTASEISEYP